MARKFKKKAFKRFLKTQKNLKNAVYNRGHTVNYVNNKSFIGHFEVNNNAKEQELRKALLEKHRPMQSIVFWRFPFKHFCSALYDMKYDEVYFQHKKIANLRKLLFSKKEASRKPQKKATHYYKKLRVIIFDLFCSLNNVIRNVV